MENIIALWCEKMRNGIFVIQKSFSRRRFLGLYECFYTQQIKAEYRLQNRQYLYGDGTNHPEPTARVLPKNDYSLDY